MTSKKWTIIISGLIALVSVAVFAVFEFWLYDLPTPLAIRARDFIIVISSGLFTSASVSLLLAASDYNHDRKRALERMYLASNDLQHSFEKLKYIFPDEPRELVENLFAEIDGNEFAKKINQQFYDQLEKSGDSDYQAHYKEIEMSLSHDAEKAFRSCVWENTPENFKEMFSSDASKERYLDGECERKIQKYSEQIEEVIRSYLIFDGVRTRELAAAYGDLDFITSYATKRIRYHIFHNLYTKQEKQVNAIKKINYHFNLYVDGKGGSRGVMLGFIWKLQDMLISEDENFYYRQYKFDIDTQMVQTLKFANGKKDTSEFPEKKYYRITTKPGYMERMMADSTE